MPRDREPLFQTEAALCEAFIAWVKGFGWTAYAETGGWDIVLVKPTGVQIGVQAKLRFNLRVLTQSMPCWVTQDRVGPDYRAVLVGDGHPGADVICEQLGLVLFYPKREYRGSPVASFEPRERELTGDRHGFTRYGNVWFDWNPERRIKLPEYVPDVAAGASGPVQLTDWKVGALRLTALLDLRGYITRADFRDHHINPTRWTVLGNHPRAWVVPGQTRGQWVRGKGLSFDQQHPAVYQQIRAEIAKRLTQGQEAKTP